MLLDFCLQRSMKTLVHAVCRELLALLGNAMYYHKYNIMFELFVWYTVIDTLIA